MADILKIVIFIAITMALSVTLTMKTISDVEEKPPFKPTNLHEKKNLMPSKRISRFLAEDKNPRAADHCHKDNDVCGRAENSNTTTTCCNNKCIDLQTDIKNCGACKNKCKYTEACCRGECVNLSYDKRHCSYCNNKCLTGEFCVYGMCNYS